VADNRIRNLDEDDLTIIDGTLRFFRQQIAFFVKKFGYEKLRKPYATLCDDVATKLNCINSKQYKKEWDNRKEYVV
jgi:hypothetical protein